MIETEKNPKVQTDCKYNVSRRYEIKNYVRLYISLSTDMGLPESWDIVTGEHIYKFMIQNGMETDQ